MFIEKNKILKFTKFILNKIGLNSNDASLIAAMLVKADMCKHFSHGTIRLIQYYNKVKSGVYSTKNKPLIKYRNNFTYVDGNRSFGQIAMKFACKSIIRDNKNIQATSVINSGHVGRLSDYVEELSNKGFVALIFCNGGGPNTSIFPIRESIIGTNPFAFGLKVKKNKNFIVDFATSLLAEGKINIAKIEKKEILSKPIITKSCKLSNKYSDLYNGGSLRPFGDIKGSAFCLVNELLGGHLISKNNPLNKNYLDGNNCFIISMKRKFFGNISNFESQFNRINKLIKNGKKIEGVTERSFLPGEKEIFNFKKNRNKIFYNKKLIINLNSFAKEKFNIPRKLELL